MTTKCTLFDSLFLLLLLAATCSYYCQAWVTSDFCRQVRAFSSLGTVAARHDGATLREEGYVRVPMPVVQWSVPKMKRGWQDDQGKWWDEDGPRDGPPMNYWRQRSDERSHEYDMKIVQRILDDTLDNEDVLSNLSCRIQKPMLNRKFLGVWAPIVSNGHTVGILDENEEWLRVPYTITIARQGPRQLGPTSGYGTFDAHLQPGEAIAVSIGDETFALTAQANLDEVQELGHVINMKGPEEIGTGSDYLIETLRVGKIAYLSDYLLIMADSDGRMLEFWTRAEAVLSVPKEKAAEIRQASEKASQTVETLVRAF